jgi:hypothetical protein
MDAEGNLTAAFGLTYKAKSPILPPQKREFLSPKKEDNDAG